jgi:hypothetical protein
LSHRKYAFNINMLALSTVFALLASFSLAVNAAPGVQPSPDLGSVFSVYPGWDMNNGRTTSILVGLKSTAGRRCVPFGVYHAIWLIYISAF